MQPREAPLALEAAIALTVAAVAVRCLPRRRLVAVLRRQPRLHRTRSGAETAAALRMIDRVAAVLPWSPPCLERALAGRTVLARRGCSSTLVLGVQRPFAAHAWLEIDGRPATPGDGFSRIWPAPA